MQVHTYITNEDGEIVAVPDPNKVNELRQKNTNISCHAQEFQSSTGILVLMIIKEINNQSRILKQNTMLRI